MTYTAKTAKQLRQEKGTLLEKVASELSSIQTEITRTNSQFAVLTAGTTTLATTGIDLASGSDITQYGVFFAPTDITVVTLHYYLTEAYVKESTTNAKIELYNDASSPARYLVKPLPQQAKRSSIMVRSHPRAGKPQLQKEPGLI